MSRRIGGNGGCVWVSGLLGGCLALGVTPVRSDDAEVRKNQVLQQAPIKVALFLPGTLIAEMESFAGKAKASAGEVSVQPMAAFGTGWGDSAQLLWRAPAPIEEPIRNYPHITFYVPVSKTGVYHAALYHTRAPDYGDARVFLDGQPRGEVHGFSTTVDRYRLDLGEMKLNPASVQVVVTIFGKSAPSKGFLVGLDRIELVPK